MNIFRKFKKIYNQEGIFQLGVKTINYFYKKTPFLPYRTANYNGVLVPEKKFILNNKPNYENGAIKSMEKNIQEGDKVVVLGGGLGVTAVIAAKLSNCSFKVEVFEGSAERVNKTKRTLQRNNERGIKVNHAIVGPKIEVYGSTKNAEYIDPQEIPECDVLEMDIEGAEIKILKNLKIRPRILIVESHGCKGATTKKVKKLIENLSYKIQNIEPAKDIEHASENDIRVITGIKN